MYTIREAAELTGASVASLRIWLADDKERTKRFPNARKESTPLGEYWLIPEGDVQDFEKRGRGRPPKPRELVTSKELKTYLTAELKKVKGCDGCTIGRILRYQQPDDDGCNWSDNVIVSSGGDISPDYLLPHVQRIVAEARKRFNLK